MSAEFRDLDERAYRAIPALSGSAVGDLLRSPAKYRYRIDHPDESPSMSLGTLAHAIILGTGMDMVAVSPYATFTTKAAKEWRDEQTAAGLTVVKEADVEAAQAMADAVSWTRAAMSWLGKPGRSEVSIVGDVDGTPVKGRIDRLADDEPRVIDLKSARDASPEGFARAVGDHAYHGQMGLYSLLLEEALGVPALPPVLVVAENTPPHLVAVYELDATAIDQGRRMALEAVNRYRDCTATGVWPDGMPEGTTPLGLRNWDFDKWDRALLSA